jgi:hypothetical protein
MTGCEALRTMYRICATGLHVELDHQREGHDEGWQEATGKKGPDGDIRDPAVDDHGNAGGHQNAHAACRANDSGGPGRCVTCLVHGRDHDGTDRCGVRRSRPGDPGEEYFRDDGNHAQAVPEMADQGACQIEGVRLVQAGSDPMPLT